MVASADSRRVLVAFACFVVAMLVSVAVLVEWPASTPPPPQCGLDCGLGFSWGTPFNDTGQPPPLSCPSVVAGNYCYSIEIAGSGGTLTTSEMNFSLRAPAGAFVPWPSGPNPDVIWLVSPFDGYPVVAQFDTSTYLWSLYGNFTGAVWAGYTVVVFTGGAGSYYGLQGDQLEALIAGVNGNATIPSASFP